MSQNVSMGASGFHSSMVSGWCRTNRAWKETGKEMAEDRRRERRKKKESGGGNKTMFVLSGDFTVKNKLMHNSEMS